MLSGKIFIVVQLHKMFLNWECDCQWLFMSASYWFVSSSFSIYAQMLSMKPKKPSIRSAKTPVYISMPTIVSLWTTLDLTIAVWVLHSIQNVVSSSTSDLDTIQDWIKMKHNLMRWKHKLAWLIILSWSRFTTNPFIQC